MNRINQFLNALERQNMGKVRKPTKSEAALFEQLVAMVQFAKRSNLDVPAAFLEELIDACVLELYFPDEALVKDLQFITATAVCLEKTIGLESEKSIREFIDHCIARKLDEKLDRLSACDAQAGLESDSPDLFAVIKQEGRV
jgi:adenine-specific DNA-methyltransferase